MFSLPKLALASADLASTADPCRSRAPATNPQRQSTKSHASALRRRAAARRPHHRRRHRARRRRLAALSPRRGRARPRQRDLGVMLLRCLALAGLLVFFLGIERRTLAKSSTTRKSPCWSTSAKAWASAKMKARPTAAPRASKPSSTPSPTARSSPQLRKTHDVNIARFDQEVEPVVSLPKSQESRVKGQEPEGRTESNALPPTLDPRPSTLDQSTGPTNFNPAARKPASARRWPMSCGSTTMRRSPA